MGTIRSWHKLCVTAFLFFPFQLTYAKGQPTAHLQNESKTYLVCYYRDKVTGQTSWEWGKDLQNKLVEIEGEWTDNSAGALLKINALDSDFEPYYDASCRHTNTNSSREYAEYGIANNSESFRHNIWFEKFVPNQFNLPFSRLIAFGDSLSDKGNLYNYSHETVVTGSYYMGRFSNGPVWSEYFSKYYHLHLYDWAVAGVTVNTVFPIPYDMDEEVDNYISTMEHVKNPAYSESLFTLLIGANNYIFRIDANPTDLVKHIILSMEKLIAVGAKHFIVPTLPDISYTPFISAEGNSAILASRERIKNHNKLLLSSLKELKEKYPFITLISPDTEVFLNDVINNPAKFNITNVKDKCDRGLPAGSYDPSTYCDEPKTYLFWDFVHPTTKVHCEMAQDIMIQVSDLYGITPFQKDYKQCDISYVNKK